MGIDVRAQTVDETRGWLPLAEFGDGFDDVRRAVVALGFSESPGDRAAPGRGESCAGGR